MTSRGGKSYWSKWRAVRASMSSHLQELHQSPEVGILPSVSQNPSDSDVSEVQDSLNESVYGSDFSEVEGDRFTSVSDSEKESIIDNVDDWHSLNNSSSDFDSDCSNDSFEDISLIDTLQGWAVHNQVPNSTLADLLSILRPYHPFLPKDPRTLLKTKLTYNVIEIAGGQYYHFGLVSNLIEKIKPFTESLDQGFCFELQLNIDGLPLFKSTNHQFWPILGGVCNIGDKNPFIIGLFSGLRKPNNLGDDMRRFIDEYREVNQSGFEFEGKTWNIKIHSIICDTPARAFVKCVKGHSGYHGCDKCEQNGEWVGKMTFPEVNATLRSDTSFEQRSDEDHHTGHSPFVDIGVGMVSQFPLDYMHLVCLGVMKRLLLLWMKGPLTCRLGARTIDDISQSLLKLKNFIPCEFARRPRSLHEIERWKATEFRQFLLYTGPVILCDRDILHPNLYKYFLLLFVGIHILVNQGLCQAYSDYAEKLLKTFVSHFYQIYGNDTAVYNVHALVHLAKDAAKYGSLESISSFPFENFLSKLKRLVRKPSFPLQQVIRRLSEQVHSRNDESQFPMLKGSHSLGPLPDSLLTGVQYKSVKTERFEVKINKRDSCVRIDGNICILKNIVQDDYEVFVVYERFRDKEDFFEVPHKSSLIGILKVSRLSDRLYVAKLEEIQTKCVLLPYKDVYVALPYSDAVWAVYKYAVVEFPEEDGVEVVPWEWLKGNQKECLWPNFKAQSKITKEVTQLMTPTSDFVSLPVRVLYQTDDYAKAREKLSLATEKSDLQTEAEEENPEKKRSRRGNKRYIQSSDSESDEPHTPKKRKSPRKGTPKRRQPPSLPPLPEWPEPEAELQVQTERIASPIRKTSTPSSSSKSLLSVFEKSPKTPQQSTLEVKIFTCLEHIKAQVHQNTKLLQALMRKTDSNDPDDGQAFNCEVFPLKSKEDLNRIEERLKDQETANQLIRSLSTIGGDSLKSTVRRILKYLICDTLAVLINWLGKGGKTAFSSLKIKDVVSKAVRRNRLTATATDSEIAAVMKDWFRFANDRSGGRRKREEKKKNRLSDSAEVTEEDSLS